MLVPLFLQNTFEMLADTSHPDIYGWGDSNDSIFIKNIEEFAKVILPKHFTHSNYSSFTRQLHKYDFHKTMHNPRHGEFKHKYFVRGRPDLLKKIKRKKYVSKVSRPTPASSAPLSPVLNPAVSNTSGTDGETDISSSISSGVSEKDGFEQDFDFDFLVNFDDNDGEPAEIDFDKFDEIESTVEKGMIAFDNERVSALEKRQAHLIEENEETKNAIHETLLANGQLTEIIDVFLSHATNPSLPCLQHHPPLALEDMDDICKMMREQCVVHAKYCEVRDEFAGDMKDVFREVWRSSGIYASNILHRDGGMFGGGMNKRARREVSHNSLGK